MLVMNLLLKSPIQIFLVLVYISYKDIIVEKEIVSCDKPAYHHDEFRLCEGEQKDSDQLLSLHFYQTKEEDNIYEEEDDDLKSPE